MASKFVMPQLAMARRQMGSMAVKKVEGARAHKVEVRFQLTSEMSGYYHMALNDDINLV